MNINIYYGTEKDMENSQGVLILSNVPQKDLRRELKPILTKFHNKYGSLFNSYEDSQALINGEHVRVYVEYILWAEET